MHPPRDLLVAVETGRDDPQLWTAPLGRGNRHGGMDPILTRLIAGCRDHTTRPVKPHSQRQSAQGRIVVLLHGGEERIHVDMDNLSLGHLDGQSYQKNRDWPKVAERKNSIFISNERLRDAP